MTMENIDKINRFFVEIFLWIQEYCLCPIRFSSRIQNKNSARSEYYYKHPVCAWKKGLQSLMCLLKEKNQIQNETTPKISLKPWQRIIQLFRSGKRRLSHSSWRLTCKTVQISRMPQIRRLWLRKKGKIRPHASFSGPKMPSIFGFAQMMLIFISHCL